jgi:hypothetical protein
MVSVVVEERKGVGNKANDVHNRDVDIYIILIALIPQGTACVYKP